MSEIPSSLWSGLLASGSLAGYASPPWQIWNARVKVSAKIEYMGTAGHGLRLTVSNRGARATTLTRIEVEDGPDHTWNLHASPEIGGIKLPVKIGPGDEWSDGVFLPEAFDETDESQDAIMYCERLKSRFGWLSDSERVSKCRVLLYFSHRTRPVKRSVTFEC